MCVVDAGAVVRTVALTIVLQVLKTIASVLRAGR